MTGMEIFVIAIGLAGGYWLVSVLLSRKEDAAPPPDQQEQKKEGQDPPGPG